MLLGQIEKLKLNLRYHLQVRSKSKKIVSGYIVTKARCLDKENELSLLNGAGDVDRRER